MNFDVDSHSHSNPDHIAPPPPKTFLVQPKTPAGRKLLIPVFIPGLEDPVYTRRKKPITGGSVVLSGIITAYTFYAIGDLPELETLFNRGDVYLRSQNDAVVNAIVSGVPYLGMLAFAGCIGAFIFLHYNRLRRSANRTVVAQCRL